MEFQKITNFLDTNSDNKDLPKFGTKEWIEVYDESKVIIKYIDIKDLVNNIKDNTISEIDAKKHWNTIKHNKKIQK